MRSRRDRRVREQGRRRTRFRFQPIPPSVNYSSGALWQNTLRSFSAHCCGKGHMSRSLNGSEGVRIGFWRRRSPPNPQKALLFVKGLEIDRRARPQIDMQTGSRFRARRAVPERANGLLCQDRRAEVAGMTWAELSEDLATWTIPATRT